MAVIEVEGLYKVFGPNPERVFPLLEQGLEKPEILEKTGCTIGINNASFSIEKREVFVVMGLSGSGKSTVIRCLNRLIEPTRGEIRISGDDIMKMDAKQLIETRRRKLSMVFQHFGLLPQRTVISNVEYGLEVSGVNAAERRRKAQSALELVGLEGYAESRPGELSGGMQQRVGLARALANDPEVLLMDEAFSALDPLIRTNMQDELMELQSRMHKTIVFITHDLDEALKIGDRIAIMKDGAVVQIGTPEEILTNPADDYVKAFVQNVDRGKVITAASVMRRPQTMTIPKDGPHIAVRTMEKTGSSSVFVLNSDRQLQGLLRIDDAVRLEKEKKSDVTDALFTDLYAAKPETPVGELLSRAMEAHYPISIIDDENRFKGIVDRATVLAEVLGAPEDSEATTLLSELTEDSADNSPDSSAETVEEEEKHHAAT